MLIVLSVFFFNDPATTEIYTLSLHDALPICHLHATADRLHALCRSYPSADERTRRALTQARSEEHTSELQSLTNLVCRLLLEKKKTMSNSECDRIRYTHLTARHTCSHYRHKS